MAGTRTGLSRKDFQGEAGIKKLEEMKKLYISELDPTEYNGAIAAVGSWDAWLKLKQNWPSFVTVILPKWRDEVEVIIRSRALTTIIEQLATADNPTVAAKYLADGKWKDMTAPSSAAQETKIRGTVVQVTKRQLSELSAEDQNEIHRVQQALH